jgi:hypothetical protein
MQHPRCAFIWMWAYCCQGHRSIRAAVSFRLWILYIVYKHSKNYVPPLSKHTASSLQMLLVWHSDALTVRTGVCSYRAGSHVPLCSARQHKCSALRFVCLQSIWMEIGALLHVMLGGQNLGCAQTWCSPLSRRVWVSVEHIPWEASSYWVSQIPRILWNPKAHYHVHSSPKIGSVNSTSFRPNPLRYILILSSPLRLCRPSDVLPSDFATKPCKYVSSPRASYMFRRYLDIFRELTPKFLWNILQHYCSLTISI